MTYTIWKLTQELTSAGIQHSGCNTSGKVWDLSNNEIQDRPDVAAVLAAHVPESGATREQRITTRQTAAHATAKAIPNWASWTQAQLQTWWNSNLADSIVDGFSVPAGVRTMLKAQNAAILREGQMLIAIRDRLMPDLPE